MLREVYQTGALSEVKPFRRHHHPSVRYRSARKAFGGRGPTIEGSARGLLTCVGDTTICAETTPTQPPEPPHTEECLHGGGIDTS